MSPIRFDTPMEVVGAGLFSSGPATIVDSLFTEFRFGQVAKANVWLVVFEREGEPRYDQPYSIGDGWRIAAGGKELVPLKGQTGLPATCNAMKHLIGSLQRAGTATRPGLALPASFLATGDPSVLIGLQVIVTRVVQEDREGLAQKKDKDGNVQKRSILEIEQITALPAAAKGTTMAAKRVAKAEAAADVPKRGRGKATSAAPDADAPADADEELLRAGCEAIHALFEEDPEPIKLKDLEPYLIEQLKGNPEAKAIAGLMSDPAVLKLQRGWTFDGKLLSPA